MIPKLLPAPTVYSTCTFVQDHTNTRSISIINLQLCLQKTESGTPGKTRTNTVPNAGYIECYMGFGPTFSNSEFQF